MITTLPVVRNVDSQPTQELADYLTRSAIRGVRPHLGPVREVFRFPNNRMLN